MRRRVFVLALAALAVQGASAVAQVGQRATSTLTAFQSDAELSVYLRTIFEDQELAAGVCPDGKTSASTHRPRGPGFYVSPSSVYVWVADQARAGNRQPAAAMLYRMPLDGSGPSAVGVAGSPVDQFSFLESEDAHRNVVVRSHAGGDGM